MGSMQLLRKIAAYSITFIRNAKMTIADKLKRLESLRKRLPIENVDLDVSMTDEELDAAIAELPEEQLEQLRRFGYGRKSGQLEARLITEG